MDVRKKWKEDHMKTQELLQALKEKTWVSLTHEVTKDMAIY